MHHAQLQAHSMCREREQYADMVWHVAGQLLAVLQVQSPLRGLRPAPSWLAARHLWSAMQWRRLLAHHGDDASHRRSSARGIAFHTLPGQLGRVCLWPGGSAVAFQATPEAPSPLTIDACA